MHQDKLYYKIGEVAQIAGLEPYVLRYWESEFKEITPIKSKSNQRLYRKKDIDTVLLIKKLLYAEGFTIDGARKKIRELRSEHDDHKSEEGVTDPEHQMTFGFSEEENNLSVEPKIVHSKNDVKLFKTIKKELEELRDLLHE